MTLEHTGKTTMELANAQQAAIRKIMADQKIPFEKAVDVYIAEKRTGPTIVLSK